MKPSRTAAVALPLVGLAAAAAHTVRSIRHGVRDSTALVPVHAEFWRRPEHEEGELLYAALGDSAGQAIGTKDPLDGYVGVLARRLAAETGRTVAVANLSVSGAVAAGVLHEQLPALARLPRVPDVVTCVIGGNDVYFRTPVLEFEESFAALVEALPPGTVLGDVPCFRVPYWEQRVNRLNRIVHARAASAGLPCARVHDATHAQGLRAHWNNLSADRFHPNERGYAVWAEALWQVLEERVRTP